MMIIMQTKSPAADADYFRFRPTIRGDGGASIA
jgi:hypothetical protein